jgi:ABC-type Fe3+-hydroxamate transport system substrate-binding protein
MSIKKMVLVILIASLLLTGCVQEQVKTETTNINAKKLPETEVTITDMAGRTVTLNKTPERVVVLTSYWVETLRLLNVDDKIVGIGNYVPSSGYISDYIKEKPKVGSTFKGLNWEAVVSLNPDLIITDWYDGKYKDKEIIERAEELGIPVVALQAKTVDDNLKCIEILGKIFGKKDRADEIIDLMQSKLNEVKEVAKQVTKKNVLIISAPKDISGPISVYAKGSAWGSIPELIGAHNMAFDREFDTQWPKVDLEKMIAWWKDADVIVVVSYSDDKLEKAVEEIKEDPRWKEIKAVKEGHVYGVPAGGKFGHFLDWGPRIVAGVYQFGSVIYPEEYPRWQKIADEILQLYGMSFYKTVKDSLGREIKIPKADVRAVVLTTDYELIVYTLGAYDHVVGVGKYHSKNPILQFLTEKGKIPENLPDLGSLWSGVNLEMLKALNPDCVIIWAYSEADIEKIRNIEETTGIPVIAIDIKTINDFYNATELLGEIFNKEDKSKEVIDAVKKEINAITSRTADISGNKVRVFLTYGLKDSQISTEGKGGINMQILQMINAVPVTENITQKYPKINFEQLYVLNPDVIILFYMYKKEPSPESIYNDPKWQDLKAIKERNVCDLRGYYQEGWGSWNPAGIPLRILAFAKCCYPDKLKDFDFNTTAERLFNQFYGISYEEMEKRVTE